MVLLIGNHEESFIKHNKSDVYDSFIRMFEVEPPKIGYVGFLKLGFCYEKKRDRANRTVLIALNHGTSGGGYLPGYPINKCHEVFRWTSADINIMGHLHKLVVDDKKINYVSQTDELVKKRRYFGISGSFLKTYVAGNTNYFEHKGRDEGDIGFLKCNMVIGDNIKIKLEKIKFD